MTEGIELSTDAITITNLEPMMTFRKTETIFDGRHDEQWRLEMYARLLRLLLETEMMVPAGAVIELEPFGRPESGYMLTVPVMIRVSELQAAELLEGMRI
jgi:hypothetical protein